MKATHLQLPVVMVIQCQNGQSLANILIGPLFFPFAPSSNVPFFATATAYDNCALHCARHVCLTGEGESINQCIFSRISGQAVIGQRWRAALSGIIRQHQLDTQFGSDTCTLWRFN